MAVASIKCLVFIISDFYLRPRDVDDVAAPLLRVALEVELLLVALEELLLVALEVLLLLVLLELALLRVVAPVLLVVLPEDPLVAGVVVVVEAPEELTLLLVTVELDELLPLVALPDVALLLVTEPEVVALPLVTEPELVLPRVALELLLLVTLPEELLVLPEVLVALLPEAAPVPLPVATEVAARLSVVLVVLVASLF